ncbi:MAG: MBL fold metallo-hydrolase [Phycisphaera sp.]|nr:MAG: MBL fold metallo-hydrolase [Phycisphaera sp.]
MQDRIISIGSLAIHPLWPMDAMRDPRPPHATTTLILDGDAAILVDPGLPGQIIASRLLERSGLSPADITHVFLTSFKADTCRGLPTFEDATWIVSEAEREAVGTPLAMTLKKALDEEGQGSDVVSELELQVAMLARCEAAPDKLTNMVSLFPLPGTTPGTCGLLLAYPTRTTLITGDAVATTEHLDQGKVLDDAHDLDKARESFAEAIEVADVIIPGRDNLLINPTRRPF